MFCNKRLKSKLQLLKKKQFQGAVGESNAAHIFEDRQLKSKNSLKKSEQV